ncbi:MAG: hypothetical protein LBT09_07965 [Planctomycetaceae bacterium]|nr:hypothetical protein [Planctomycetaceae bacterium]
MIAGIPLAMLPKLYPTITIMRSNLGTIISFVLLLLALLINIFRYPQVHNMLDRDLQANLFPPMLSYEYYNFNNFAGSKNSDNSNDSEDSNDSENFENSDKLKHDNSTVAPSSKITQPELPDSLPQPATPATPATPTTPAIVHAPKLNPPPMPVEEQVVPERINSPKPNETQIQNPPKENISQPNNSQPDISQPDILQEKTPEKELLPEMNLSNEKPMTDLSLQNILPDKNFDGIIFGGADAKYVIYSPHSPAAPIQDSPQPIYAQNYKQKKSEQNETQTKSEIKQNIIQKQHLINTIETTLERPIIYD